MDGLHKLTVTEDKLLNILMDSTVYVEIIIIFMIDTS